MSAPTTVKLAITLQDGTVALMAFVTVQPPRPGHPGWTRADSDANLEAEVQKTLLPSPPVSWRRIAEAEIPSQDRVYRGAWRDTGSAIAVDMARAREIQLDRVRRARGPKLAALDQDWTKAMGQGDAAEAARVEAARQVLRDLPVTLDVGTATTPDALKALWPPELAE